MGHCDPVGGALWNASTRTYLTTRMWLCMLWVSSMLMAIYAAACTISTTSLHPVKECALLSVFADKQTMHFSPGVLCTCRYASNPWAVSTVSGLGYMGGVCNESLKSTL